MSGKNSSPTADREIVSTRVFNAPRALLWKIWTEPRHLAQWWGPKGFTNTFAKHDFKVDGEWLLTMHAPNGGPNFDNQLFYREIDEPARLVIEHTSKPYFRITVTFDDLGGRTRVNFQQVFESAEACESVKRYAILANQEFFTKSEAVLAQLTGLELPKELVITRTFEASRELTWKLWTDPRHLAAWWGPTEIKVGEAQMDFRRGGSFHYSMVPAEGPTLWGKFDYIDIVEPERLVWVNSFSDKEGGLGVHPAVPKWPAEMLTTVLFAEKWNLTEVTIKWYPINATEESIRLFNENHADMERGWSGSLDRLASYAKTAT